MVNGMSHARCRCFRRTRAFSDNRKRFKSTLVTAESLALGPAGIAEKEAEEKAKTERERFEGITRKTARITLRHSLPE